MSNMREHDEANKILDMPERADRVAYFLTLPKQIKPAVGELVKIATNAAEYHRHLSWRVYRE